MTTTTTTERPETIRASIHQDAINRVSEFFNATNRDILNELLQNCRRSGATRVDITNGDGVITVQDDGAGIKDPASILAFGRTEWEAQDAQNEHPAGMGLYALARCEQVRIVTRTAGDAAWRVDLTPRHFTGDLDAPVETLYPHWIPRGTGVTFSSSQTDSLPDIKQAVQHHPLPVRINGMRAPQEDFLHAALHVEEWRGVRIGVYRHGQQGKMNFHGIVVNRPGLPDVRGIVENWSVKVDVLDCPELTLTLPARREVVENPFMKELRTACQAAVYRAIARMDDPPDVPFYVQQDAASLGISLPDASPRLRPWEPLTARDNALWPSHLRRETLCSDPIVMDAAAEAQDLQALGRAAEAAGLTGRMYEPDSRLSGYGWYDQLVRAQEMTITINGEQGPRDLEELRADEKMPVDQRPESILITLNLSDSSDILLDAEVAFLEGMEGDCRGDKGTPLVTRKSGIRIHELTRMMMDAYFRPDYDGDADSADTQEHHLEEEYQIMATKLLLTPEEAARETIAREVQRTIAYMIPPGMNAVISVKPLEGVTVLLEKNG